MKQEYEEVMIEVIMAEDVIVTSPALEVDDTGGEGGKNWGQFQ